MQVRELIKILGQLPEGAQVPIIRGRHEPEIFVSIPENQRIPWMWEKAAEVPRYYPEGTKRIKYTGPV